MSASRIGVILSVLMAGVIFVPSIAVPAPVVGTPLSSAIEAKKAEEQAALRDLDRMRAELAAEVKEYVRIGRRLERTREEIAEVQKQIAEVNADLERKREAVVARAVELYRNDREAILSLLFEAQSFNDLILRYRYVRIINGRDAQLIREMRLARIESEWLYSSLADREGYLIELQEQADRAREQIEAAIEAQEARAEQIGADLAALMRQAAAAAAMPPIAGVQPDGKFDPDIIIQEANFRAATSMGASQIQEFLERQSGTLASYRGPDHAGTVKTAAEIIAEAALAWNVNPKVILVKLQKEQSLLSNPNPTQYAYDWAMGCGKTDSRTLTQFQGFGKQVWHGARILDKHARLYRPGIELTITGSKVRPMNAATYSLYRYTPHMRGNMSFWLIYWRHFGDPLAR